jgi:hypothetical protein
MYNCTSKNNCFSPCKGRKIEVNFQGGAVTSDAGIILLREVDRKLELTKALAEDFPDERDQRYVDHSIRSMMAQRIHGLALGYEDLNDHKTLRKDIGFQTAIDCDVDLASVSTLSRFENAATRETAINTNRLFVETFISTFKKPPKELILDFDPTDDRIHGHQANRYYHGYYKSYCYLPLYVFCNDQLLVSYLRPCNIDGAKHAWAILKLLVKRLRQEWPEVKIIFRGDSGFCRDLMLRWCDKHNVGYITGIGSNNRLLKASVDLRTKAAEEFERTQEKQKLFGEFEYAAKTWKANRKIIVKAEHTSKGANPRFTVTNLSGAPQMLYEEVYCGRGDMENRIKEQQLDLFADRTSCHNWWPNQFRLLLSGCAYVLISELRRTALKGTALLRFLESVSCWVIENWSLFWCRKLPDFKFKIFSISNTSRTFSYHANGNIIGL